MKKKEISTGKHSVKFDNSSLILKKNDLLNTIYNYYRKSIDFKYEREYYKNKLENIDSLREAQLDYLIDVIENNINTLETKKNNILDRDDAKSKSNVNIVNNTNNTLAELELYKNDVKKMFAELKEKEKEELTDLILKSDKNRIKNAKLAKNTENEIEKFITQLTNLNKKTETDINNLVDNLDIKLENNNQLGLKLVQNQPKRSYDELTKIINTNFNTVKYDLQIQRRFFFLGIVEIILIILILLYLGKKTSARMLL
jgi:hypothetical protein